MASLLSLTLITLLATQALALPTVALTLIPRQCDGLVPGDCPESCYCTQPDPAAYVLYFLSAGDSIFLVVY